MIIINMKIRIMIMKMILTKNIKLLKQQLNNLRRINLNIKFKNNIKWMIMIEILIDIHLILNGV